MSLLVCPLKSIRIYANACAYAFRKMVGEKRPCSEPASEVEKKRAERRRKLDAWKKKSLLDTKQKDRQERLAAWKKSKKQTAVSLKPLPARKQR